MKKLNPLSSRRAKLFYSNGPKLAGARGSSFLSLYVETRVGGIEVASEEPLARCVR
jgi:hypothetical protein